MEQKQQKRATWVNGAIKMESIQRMITDLAEDRKPNLSVNRRENDQ